MTSMRAFAAVALVFATTAAALAQDEALQRQIMAKERQELDCLKTGDYAQFAGLLAEDAVFVDAHGSANKDAVVRNTKDFRLQEYTIEDPAFVRISKDSALMTYKITETGVSHGRAFSATVYVSALWAKRNGKWLCLFSQESASR